MFIKTVPKKDKGTGKIYRYYRLCQSYRQGNSVRHRNILSLGTLDELSHYQDYKDLADRIEQLITGNQSLFGCANPVVEQLAQSFSKLIIDKKLIDRPPAREEGKTLHTIDLDSVAIENAREIGGESLCLQALDQLDIGGCLQQAGFGGDDIGLAKAHIIGRALFPASEHATADWMKDNSAICEILGIDANKISRHKLYRISRMLSNIHERIESYLSDKTNNLFNLQDKIILYDLTNSYFEGRKLSSILAAFAKSKEKRQDAKLITLALVVNVEGFVKYSKIYRGNIGEITTLEITIDDLNSRGAFATGSKPMVVMDAGIASEENLLMLRNKGYDYLCVARGKFKDYSAVKKDNGPVMITDKRKSPIELVMIEQPGIDDLLLFVRSEKKAKKEVSMHENFTAHFEEGLTQILHGIKHKNGTKKAEKVWERIGRLKERYPSAHQFYELQLTSEKGVSTNLEWKKIIPVGRKQDGIYFLRTSAKQVDERVFWDIYNTIREIESVFRTLKTDLKMRPVFHQTDENTIAHLHLAVLAYQMVHTIRYQLKAKGINHDWSHIVRIMNTQKAATVTMKDKNDQKIFIRKCTIPEPKATEIYNALGYKPYPFLRKSVLPETVDRKSQSLGTG